MAVKETSVQGAVYTALKDAIMSLQLKPGTAISTQEIATKLEVSRTPVREAFIRLQREGLVEMFPQKETLVSRINLERVEQERFLRKSLELAIIESFMKKHVQDDIVQLKKNLKKQEALKEEQNYNEFLLADNEFHKLFFEVSGQQLSWETIASANGHYDRIRLISLWEKDISKQTLKQHRRILEAVEDGDIKAAKKELEQHTGRILKEQEELIQKYPDYFEQETKKRDITFSTKMSL